MSNIEKQELDKWQDVSDGAKANGHQAFRVTPDFMDRIIARVRNLEATDYTDRLRYKEESTQLKERVTELEQMCKVSNEYGDASLSDYNRELLRAEALEIAYMGEPTVGDLPLIDKARALGTKF